MVEFNRPDLRERVRIGLKVAEQFGLEFSEVVQLTLPVGNLITPNLFEGYPKGAWGRTSMGAFGAGDSSQVGIQAASDRGIIYHVTQMIITGVITGNVRIRVGNGIISTSTGFLVVTTKQYTDARDGGTPDCGLFTSGPLAAAVDGSPVAVYDVSDVKLHQFPLDVVLGQNGFLLVENMTTNEALDVSWRWTEYLLEDR